MKKDDTKNIPKVPPVHTRVPETNFTVDWHCKTLPEFQHSFISHAHSDHMMGLASFRPPRILHCTELTGALLRLKVPKCSQSIFTHSIGSVFVIDNVTIHILDANHTPGSCMFLFDLPSGKRVLFTGDFRAEPKILDNILPFTPIDFLYIDCTFADSKLIIPPRIDVTNFVIERVKSNLNSTLIMIGTYSTGKEDLIFDVAEQTGSLVYSSSQRIESILQMVEVGYRSNCKQYITSDPSAARIHLVGIESCKVERALSYTKSLGYNRACVICPSGWNGKAFWQTPRVETVGTTTVICYNVPYSDHCSPEEVENFVRLTRPRKFIPITQHSARGMLVMQKKFFKYLRKDKNPGYLDFYFSPTRIKDKADQKKPKQLNMVMEETLGNVTLTHG